MSFIPTMMESEYYIQRPAISRDSASGVLQTFVNVNTDPLPCCVAQAHPHIQALYGQRNAPVPASVYFPIDPGVQPNDRLLITDRLGVSKLFLVQGESQPLGRGHTWYCSATYIGAPS